jgi:hypothetical protein
MQNMHLASPLSPGIFLHIQSPSVCGFAAYHVQCSLLQVFASFVWYLRNILVQEEILHEGCEHQSLSLSFSLRHDLSGSKRVCGDFSNVAERTSHSSGLQCTKDVMDVDVCKFDGLSNICSLNTLVTQREYCVPFCKPWDFQPFQHPTRCRALPTLAHPYARVYHRSRSSSTPRADARIPSRRIGQELGL